MTATHDTCYVWYVLYDMPVLYKCAIRMLMNQDNDMNMSVYDKMKLPIFVSSTSK